MGLTISKINNLIEQINNTQERICLRVYSKIAFESPVSIAEIDFALNYFATKGYEISKEELSDPILGSKSSKIILLDNLISCAHEKEREFSPLGLRILNLLAE